MSSIAKNTLFAEINGDYCLVNEQDETLMYEGEEVSIWEDQQGKHYIHPFNGHTIYINKYYRTKKEWNKSQSY